MISYEEASAQLKEINQLVEDGVLGPELMPEEKYLEWPILQADKVPQWLSRNHPSTSTVRWYLHR